jgi:hypothetical protein
MEKVAKFDSRRKKRKWVGEIVLYERRKSSLASKYYSPCFSRFGV